MVDQRGAGRPHACALWRLGAARDQFDQASKSFQGANYKGRKVCMDEAEGGQGAPRGDGPRPSAPHSGGYQGGGGSHRGGSGGGYKGAGGGYKGGDSRGDRPQSDRPQSGGYKGGNDDRGGYQKKQGFFEPKPKFPKKSRG